MKENGTNARMRISSINALSCVMPRCCVRELKEEVRSDDELAPKQGFCAKRWA